MGYWEGVGPEDGKIVDDDVAFKYALERCENGTKEEKEEFVEWFYSGNWIRKYDHLHDEGSEMINDGEPLRD